MKKTKFLSAAVLLLALMVSIVQAGEPVMINVASAKSVCASATDSTTVDTVAVVDLRKYDIDISSNVTVYWKISSSDGAVNANFRVYKAPTAATTNMTGVDTLVLYASRTTETAANDTIKVATYPIAPYLVFICDPNTGAAVTGRADTAIDLMLVGHRRAYTGAP